MKKVLIIALFAFLVSFSIQSSHASDYLTYQEITFEHSGPRFLDDYTQKMYDKYYERIKKRKFFGWSVKTAYKTEKVYFTKETIFKIYNEGTTSITQTFSLSNEESIKKQYNTSGTIKLKATGDAVGAKLGFEEKLAYSITASTATQTDEDFTVKVYVDPNTELFIEICGEGSLSNGVAKKYAFWRVIKKGGWEVFLVTTEYYSLRKEIIDESLIIVEE